MVGIILGNGGGSGADVSNVDATAETVLAPKVFVDSNGDEITGVIPTYTGAANLVPDGSDHPFSNIYIPANGLTVKAISLQNKTVYPSYQDQTITPDSGKYLAGVTVKGIKSVDTVPTYISSYRLELNPDQITFDRLIGVEVYLERDNSAAAANMMLAASYFSQGGIEAGDGLNSISLYSSASKLYFCDAYNEIVSTTTAWLHFLSVNSGGSIRIASGSSSQINKFNSGYTYKATLYYV